MEGATRQTDMCDAAGADGVYQRRKELLGHDFTHYQINHKYINLYLHIPITTQTRHNNQLSAIALVQPPLSFVLPLVGAITFPDNTSTPPKHLIMSETDPGFLAALEEAKQGFAEGGVPIGEWVLLVALSLPELCSPDCGTGACLVSKDGTIIGRGHNMRVQKGSATLHVR